jgi:ribosome-associated translation inhibitor RaiA
MDNSQFKPGPDLFKVRLVITGNKYGGIILEKSAKSLYTALAEVSNHMLERLNRFGDKQRIKNRSLARKLLQAKEIEQEGEIYDENSI